MIAYGSVLSKAPDGTFRIERKPPQTGGAPGWPNEAPWEAEAQEILAELSGLLDTEWRVAVRPLTALANTTGGRIVVAPRLITCIWRLAAASTLNLMVAAERNDRTAVVVLTVTIGMDILSDPGYEMAEAVDGLGQGRTLDRIREFSGGLRASE